MISPFRKNDVVVHIESGTIGVVLNTYMNMVLVQTDTTDNELEVMAADLHMSEIEKIGRL